MPNMKGEAFASIDSLTIDLDGVTKHLQGINPKKQTNKQNMWPRPEGISSQLLQDLSKELVPVICHIFSKSLSRGDLPDD